jgi:hypothetical protein
MFAQPARPNVVVCYLSEKDDGADAHSCRVMPQAEIKSLRKLLNISGPIALQRGKEPAGLVDLRLSLVKHAASLFSIHKRATILLWDQVYVCVCVLYVFYVNMWSTQVMHIVHRAGLYACDMRSFCCC